MTAPPPVAVAAVFRRETRYLREWLEFHLRVGVGRFYLCNHDLDGDRPASNRVLAPYVAAGLAVNHYWAVQEDFQYRAYTYMLSRAARDGFAWLALLDIDEFLFPVEADSLRPVLDAYADDHAAGVLVQCRHFGSNGLRHPPMLQTEALTRCTPPGHPLDRVTKPILRVDAWRDAAYADDPPAGTHWLDEDGRPRTAARRDAPYARLRVNHYGVRSAHDWGLRVRRGLVPGGFRLDPKDLPNYFAHRLATLEHNEAEDKAIWRFLPDLKERLDIEH